VTDPHCQQNSQEPCRAEQAECSRLRERIREQERTEVRFQNLFEAVSEAIVSFSVDGHILRANKACRRILGTPPELLLAKSLEKVFPLTTMPQIETAFAFALEGEAREIESRFICPSGKEVLLALLLAPIWEEGMVTGVLLTARDLTGVRLREQERSRLYEELQESHRALEDKALALEESQERLKVAMAEQAKVNADLREIDRIKSDFIGIASHELRTPLTFLLGSLEYLYESLPERLSEDERVLLDYSMQGARRLSDIVEDMLDIVRIEAEGFSLRRHKVGFYPLLQEVHLELSWALKERNIQLVFSPEEDWPPLLADAAMVRRVFTDLLENAIKYTADGGRIEVRARQLEPQGLPRELLQAFYPEGIDNLSWQGDFLQVLVRDTGIGISAPDLPRIFNRFYVAGKLAEHSTGNKYQGRGVGLGLALVKRIVHGHGGLVWAESPGTAAETGVGAPGSCIYLAFPLDLQPAAFEAEEGTLRNRRPRILLIDDEPAIRRFVQVLLADQFDLEVASGGGQGLEAASSFKPDLILLDLYMQGMDGFEVCKQLKAQEGTRDIPVAMFTAVARKHEREKGFSVGAVDYISKPFFPRELLKRIRALLQEHGFKLEDLEERGVS
jgi:PAS domain S-box-containing protein